MFRRTGLFTIPNLISMARIASIPVLFAFIFQHRENAFAWLFFASLISDILDGLIARMLKMQTKLGALLDSIADALLNLTSIAGLFEFKHAFLRAHAALLSLALLMYLLTIVCALLKFGKLASFHTLGSRITAYATGIFLLFLFLGNDTPWVFFPAVTLGIVAHAEVLLMIAIARQWTPGVIGIRKLIRMQNKAST
jgi:phosphatidylglycerophosphate synthase